MRTIKLYERDAYLKSCKATVIDTVEYKGNQGYIFDQTVLYPTGGGQPNDLGSVNGMDVIDVSVIDDEIITFIKGELTIGEEVEMSIDWNRRFDHMQQHSGEHIISGVLCQLYNCDNVGFHLGKDEIIIDYNTILNKEQIQIAQDKANEAIYQDISVHIFTLEDDLDYRSKKELSGDIRIVEFGEYDRCACCGTHVHSAGSVGMILVTGFEIIKKGTRIHLLCGKRAIDYVQMIMNDSKKISAIVSKPIGELTGGVEKLVEDSNHLKNELSTYKKEYISSILNQFNQEEVFYANDRLDASSAKLLLNGLEGRKEVFILYNGMFIYASHNVNRLLTELRKQFVVKGGGKNNFAQGKIEATIQQIENVYRGL